MRIATIIVRLLLGLAFFVFGLNGFLNFIPAPPLEGAVLTFMQATAIQSHFLLLAFATQLIAGALLLVNRFVPFALALLAAVIANILDFHVTVAQGGFGPPLVVTVLWLFLVWRYRASFAPLFAQATFGERR